jgi:hypothetical protein
MSVSQSLKIDGDVQPRTGLTQLTGARLGECAGASRHLVDVTTLRAPNAVPLAAGRLAWYKGC